MKNAREFILLFFKGVAMGAANVIPGVSGGTIAFITGIYDKLIESLKRLDIKAVRLFFTGKFKEFANYINLWFLVFLFLGVGISLVTLGRFLKWLINLNDGEYKVHVWAFFFGLIVASVYSVGKTIRKWNISSIAGLLMGTLIAVSLAFVQQANENESFVYLIICGVVAICSMLLPGLSGSYVLILLGNYELIMLTAVPNGQLDIVLPVAIGAGLGFVILSRLISYLLKNKELITLGTLTGFILGSLLTIWPWKNEIYKIDADGLPMLKSSGEQIVENYERFLPSFSDGQTIISIVLMIVGAALVLLLDKFGSTKGQTAN